ncbi:uncharacterized protein MONBRDRAFT_7991 [Monosiga brevicollis MX1]|uniref:Uncharacterized protein n=1 Tax=Monosiga brevicollis TaxID=81824 RepID=A9UYQ1_MONBE|nr:uncharacterized protein MONBRDRAFT_7991 [Monosiga brevicollis MX1]EDQ89502.1 predicted protein [Monosiga brevicollis MX1]|eukprot:XP_001745531.1 hypothetical protein [Monosiga brevicollis MX1]
MARFKHEYVETTYKGNPVLGRKWQGKLVFPRQPGYLTPGEQGYLATMRQLFEEAMQDQSISTLLVFDDDALLHCNFTEALSELLSEERCGSLVDIHGTGGVLLLGATIWINGTFPSRGRWTGGWRQVMYDIRATEKRTGRRTQCFNVDRKTMGTFGVIYHRHTFPYIIEWIQRAEKPFDHIWAHLTDKGFPVRAARDAIVVQDVRHESSVDPSRGLQEDLWARARQHRWDMSRFCDPATGASLQVPK